MARSLLLLPLLGLTAAAPSPRHSQPLDSRPAAVSRQEKAPVPNVTWVARYGAYDTKQGSWNLVPDPRIKAGC